MTPTALMAQAEFLALHEYAKRVWFSNGIHHHYSSKKLDPGFSRAWFEDALRSVPALALFMPVVAGMGGTMRAPRTEIAAPMPKPASTSPG